MVNKPLIRPYFLGGVALGGAARIPLILSGDSWMYPYQRTPMGNPYRSPIYPYSSWVFMGYYPQESLYKPYKYHGYTVRGTPNCPLILTNQDSMESRARFFSWLRWIIIISRFSSPSQGDA